MITLDDLYTAFRTTLLASVPVNSIVPGSNWLIGRQSEGASAAGPYGIIQLQAGRIVQSSSFIIKYYTLTLTAYITASTTIQDNLSAALATLLDYQSSAVTVSGGSVNMISPLSLDQRVESQMRSGSDVVPIISQWLVRTVETRA